MISHSALESSSQCFNRSRVIVVGDVMVDDFVYGSAARISPEAPIPVLNVSGEHRVPGGAGNVARNISGLKCESDLFSVAGVDPAAAEFEKMLADLERCTVRLIRELERKTSIKTRYIAGNQQIVRVDRESTEPISEETQFRLRNSIVSAISDECVVVLSDYGKGVLTPNLISEIITKARQVGVPVIVDPKGKDFGRYRGANVITPNKTELALATNMSIDSDQAIVTAAQRILDTCEIDAVLATRSEEGMSLITKAGQVVHLPADAREVYDVSGAGDTVVATLAVALATGHTLVEAAEMSNTAAGIVVGKRGTAVVHADELALALRRKQQPDGAVKIVSLNELEPLVRRWRADGESIGFTNGCFDLLHPGHLALITEAGRTSDRLIVGINSDQSIRKIKGPQRPIQSEIARGTVLGFLEAVDAVVIFDEETPQKLLEIIRPDLLIKGGDYTLDGVFGADFVRSYGGKVMVSSYVPQQSTTRLVERMRCG